jgi:phosphoglycerate dehydrogenase-like enzyme
VITPHIGGAAVESIAGARIFLARKLADFIKKNLFCEQNEEI